MEPISLSIDNLKLLLVDLEEATKSFHITMLMKEFLGIDWQFFVPLKDKIFIEAGFRRHHFRDDPNRKHFHPALNS